MIQQLTNSWFGDVIFVLATMMIGTAILGLIFAIYVLIIWAHETYMVRTGRWL